ncbi:unnamed protein product [Cuscuta epithymum]|uniref:non-specific serine/threonine protein kinase n=1 Tax=Cuscuta epithymum TaxID=186058 RepID=A0AAV0C4G5_9ASTE|nr:unnamed protein product [Cuscuta epithymum]
MPGAKIHLLSVLLLCSTMNASYPEPENDLDTLLKLKASMVGQGSTSLGDWSAANSSSPAVHCSFSGVTCDGDSRVVSLNISHVPLFGTLPPEIGLLDRLVNLTLVSDNLTGPLPLEFAKLSSIRFVNLSGNSFSGDFPREILLGMVELRVFDVYNNDFTGSLPREFLKLKKLETLKLGGNFFTGEIPEVYSDIQSLKCLALQGNSLTGVIPPSLAKLPNLEELRLGYYNSYEGGIPPELGSVATLRLLDLGGCNLTGEIPPELGNLKQLHTLFLQMNHLTGHIPAELSGLESLMSLDLSVNELTGEIPAGFSNLKNLTLINLFKNKFHGGIPSFIGDFQYLQVLQVWGNNFTFELPENIGRNSPLVYLDVASNRFTGPIPKDLCIGGRLNTLILMENFFFGSIPEGLGNCKSLIRVRMMKNFLNGTIPPGFFSLPFLDMFELRDNYLFGDLPAEFSAKNLTSLSLSNNWLTGKIHHSLGNLENLVALSLDSNRFSGEIPVEISKLQNLVSLDLSDNILTGEIPASLTQCKELYSIDLSGNNLTGAVPEQISMLTSLNELNLSNNQLEGAIPSELGAMTSLTVLDLSNNDFSGRRPVNGQLKFFNDRIFAGNPRLCSPHTQHCPSSSSPSFHKNRHTSKTVITLIISAAVGSLLAATWMISTRGRTKKSRRAYKLTAFQRLDFKASDVLECLKEENVIGKGGAGVVYRGCMPNGTDIAIKKIVRRGSDHRNNQDRGFKAEIQTLGRIRHRNIVRLIGYLKNKETNLLLYEYMSNGSLGEMLHGSKGGHLQWEMRYKIAMEAAKGLCYLHHDCCPSIIHRDVKSNNILLDSDYEAHVADFGLAKFLFDADGSQCMSSVAGSYGYIAPEYAYTLKVDQKSDVYSFGVVLLELIVGRKPVGEFGDGVDIVRWVRKTVSELPQPSDAASVLAVVDSRLKGYSLQGVVHMFKIAMLCVEDDSRSRPSMREVVHMLTNLPPDI